MEYFHLFVHMLIVTCITGGPEDALSRAGSRIDRSQDISGLGKYFLETCHRYHR